MRRSSRVRLKIIFLLVVTLLAVSPVLLDGPLRIAVAVGVVIALLIFLWFQILQPIAFRKVARRLTLLWERGGIARNKESSSAHTDLKFLLLTSNGAGLGHLTRLYAVLNELPKGSAKILTLSSAYGRVGLGPDQLMYFPSYGALKMDPDTWNGLFEAHLSSILGAYRPKTVLFDGTFVYPSVTRACRKTQTNLAWLQRGCWKEEVVRHSQQRHNAHLVCDDVIIPGDYGVTEHVESGRHLEPKYVGPVVVQDESPLLSRVEACGVLGLSPAYRYVLVQLGAGIINSVSGMRDLSIATIENLGKEWRPVVTQNPLSRASREDDRVLTISQYPVSRYYAAFEFTIQAAGYNSVQETIARGVPSVFVPNLETKTDDQLRRAVGIAQRDLGLVARNHEELVYSIQKLANDKRRSAVSGGLRRVEPATGATEIAKILEQSSSAKE